MGIGTTEILLILVLGLLIFGAGKLPDVARKAGQAFHTYRQATGEINKIKNPATWVDALTKEPAPKEDAPEKKDPPDQPAS